MVGILENWLMPDDRGFEWGSGRSTLWFAERVGSLVSVEHDPKWHRWVNEELNVKGLKNVEYRLCEDEFKYAKVASEYPSESFDFCLVDGLARDECALAAISLVKPGGIVVIDNCNWYLPTPPHSHSPFSRRREQGPYTEQWAAYLDGVRDWRHIWTTNGVTDTCVWLKPAGVRELNYHIDTLERSSSQYNS
jgi:predicted O-methyltransferase YrrM